jgi:hypothetical protein
VYNQIENDLLSSIELLSDHYVNAANMATTERTRPNQFAAQALLARTYLFEGKWSNAESAASNVITSTPQYALCSNLNQVFLKNSPEAIWQLQATVPGSNTYAGALFPFTSLPSNVSLTSDFVASFESADLRKSSWVKTITVSGSNYSFPYKYKVGQNSTIVTEYTMVLRLAEVYLIRAEARSRQSLFTLACGDINLLRNRANLASVALTTLPALVSEIERQRRSELFAEAGDRWIDLRRNSRLDAVMPLLKGSNWVMTDQLYPIPQVEIDRNHLLIQNPGY